MATSINDGAGAGHDGNDSGGGKRKNLCGAPFPPRPKAIATFLSSDDFLPGCQTLLHSLKTHLAPTPDGRYPPEILVLLSSRVGNAETTIIDRLHPIFCDRVLRVNHIPISEDHGEDDEGDEKPSHVRSWDENCGWTKLRLFELESYDTILYLDADCLVVKDVGHLLRIDESANSSDDDETRRKGERATGLLAAAPDIFPPDKFNAGVMVLRPSKTVFEDMMSRLPNNSTPRRGDSTEACKSYDGGDTGFLNAFYPGWYADMPGYSRLPFGYNAQRFMHHCTYEKQPKYWDDAIDDIRIIHFSSSPKPWQKHAENSSGDNDDRRSYLNEEDASGIRTARKRGELERIWQTAYEESQRYHSKAMRERASARRVNAPRRKAPPPPARKKQPNAHRMVQTRYKELRKSGMATKEAMTAARAEYGLDRADEGMDPSRAVGQMFGLV